MLQNRKLTFSENLSDSLLKNGHFKNVQFLKTPTQIYLTFFMWDIIKWDIYVCVNATVPPPTIHRPVHTFNKGRYVYKCRISYVSLYGIYI